MCALQGGVLTMGQQLINFENYIGKLRAAVGTEKASDIISKALIIISSGNNDVAFAYSFTPRHFLPFNVYSGMLVSAAQNFLKVRSYLISYIQSFSHIN